MIFLVAEDGSPLPIVKPMTEAEHLGLDRRADLYWSYQLGDEAAVGDFDNCHAQLLDTFPNDATAHHEFERGFQFILVRTTKQYRSQSWSLFTRLRHFNSDSLQRFADAVWCPLQSGT